MTHSKAVLCVFLYYKGKDGWKYGYHLKTYNPGETKRVLEHEKGAMGHGDPNHFRLVVVKCDDTKWANVDNVNKGQLAKINKGE